MLKVSIAQLNPTVGDFSFNAQLIKNAFDLHTDSDLVVTPELSLCGYYPADYMLEPEFLKAQDHAFREICQYTKTQPKKALQIGLIRKPRGAKFSNSLAVIQNGEIIYEYSKRLLPTYNVFDESRHFESGITSPIMTLKGHKVGFVICEDGWWEESSLYERQKNPIEMMTAKGAELIISINASPSSIGKIEQREALYRKNNTVYKASFIYVNQVGGQDSLVFDGSSFCVNKKGGISCKGSSFKEEVYQVQFDKGEFKSNQALGANYNNFSSKEHFYLSQITLGLKDYMRRTGFTKVLVGSSGGIDSALTIAIAALALGADKVEAITMPSKFSSNGSVVDSKTLCENLGVKLFEMPIINGVKWVQEESQKNMGYCPEGLSLENLQARIRGTLLMTRSNSTGALLLTTGNKSEVSVGYCTLYGDTSGGLNLIGDLYKTEVFSLSRFINNQEGREIIPQIIIDKEPSAELAPDQKDSDSLPPYPVLDLFLMKFIEGVNLSQNEYRNVQEQLDLLCTKDSVQYKLTEQKIKKLIAKSEFKRKQAAPIIKVRPRSFGAGRQVPVSAGTNWWTNTNE